MKRIITILDYSKDYGYHRYVVRDSEGPTKGCDTPDEALKCVADFLNLNQEAKAA